jgi:hypothetical protein
MTYTLSEAVGRWPGRVIVVIGEVVMLAQAAPALTARARHGSDTDVVVMHRQRSGWASGYQSRDRCGQRYSRTTSRLRSRTSRQRGKHCGEECRDDRERSVGTTGRAGRVRAAVGVLGHESGKVQGGESRGEMLMGIYDDLDCRTGIRYVGLRACQKLLCGSTGGR